MTFEALTLVLESFEYVVYHVIKLHTKYDRNVTVVGEVINDLAYCRRRYITL